MTAWVSVRRRRGVRRAGLGLVDQGLYSLTNFVLTIVVARSISAEGFGSYALISATYLVLVAVTRGLTSETFVVRFSSVLTRADDREDPDGLAGGPLPGRDAWRFAASACAGTALAVGVVAGVALVALGLWVLPDTLADTAVVFGVTMPGLLVQDFIRFAALAEGRPSKALINDVLVAVVQFGVSGLLIAHHQASVSLLVLAWGGAATLGAVVGCLQVTGWPRPHRMPWWFTHHGDLAVRYAVDDATNQGAQQINGYVVAAVQGVAYSGALRAAQTVFGPPSIANMGMMTAVTPELVRLRDRSPRRMHAVTLLLSVGQGAIGLGWTVAALLAPDDVGRALFGATWHLAQPLIVFFGISQVANGLRVGPSAGLRALGDGRRTLRARGVVVVIGVLGTLVGGLLGGARGVAIAYAVVSPLQAVVWAWQYRAAYRAFLDAHAAPAAAMVPTPPA